MSELWFQGTDADECPLCGSDDYSADGCPECRHYDEDKRAARRRAERDRRDQEWQRRGRR